MDWLFGKRKTPAELLRENKRMLDKAIRELDRERMALQTQEKKVINEIKKTAKEGQMDAVKVMAKSLVRNRHAVTKLYGLKSQLQAVSLRVQAMRMMNKRMNLPSIQNIMREFEKQNERMEMTSEIMGDAIDDAMEGEDEAEESDDLISQVLDEIGISTTQQMVSAPAQAVPTAQVAAPAAAAEAMEAGGGIDHDLQERLNNLRKL